MPKPILIPGHDLKIEYKYIRFLPEGVTHGKTAWVCQNTKSLDHLGRIEYYPQWRQYVFAPTANTIFSVVCLKDIQAFIGQFKLN